MSESPVIVVGAGYVGARVIAALGDTATLALGRSSGLDLDSAERLPVELPSDYRLLYTVAPARDATGDVRLQRLLGFLDPAPAVLTYLSTTGVYGDCGGDEVDENTPGNPGTARARRRAAAENTLREWCDGKPTAFRILRVPGIYGPGRLGLERIREGIPVIAEADAGPGNRIHVDDLVDCCLAALADGTPAGVFNVGDGDFRSSTWFAREVARQAGLPAPPEVSLETAERTFPASRLSFLSESRRVLTARMRDELGVTPTYADPAEGIRASL